MEKPLEQELAQRLKKNLSDNEEWLIKRILSYARNQGYTVYLPALEEAWRNSVRLLNKPVMDTPSAYFGIPELHPHADYFADPYAIYGITEAKRCRETGMSIVMFMGLFKYYRQTYDDLLIHFGFTAEETVMCRTFLKRYFDHVELGFIQEYLGQERAYGADDQSAVTRRLFSEKSLYATVIETIEKPIIVMDKEGAVIYMNASASDFFGGGYHPGTYLYGQERPDISPELADEFISFLRSGMRSRDYAFVYEKRIYRIEIYRMKDISGKFGGAVAMLSDITDKRIAQTTLAESESFRSALIEGISGAAVVLNMEHGTIEEYNKKAVEMFPYLITGEAGREPKFYDDTGLNPVNVFELAEMITTNEERLAETVSAGMMPIRVFSIEVWFQSQRHKLLIMFDITREKMLERRLGFIQHLETVGEIALSLPDRMGQASREIQHTLDVTVKALKDCPNVCGHSAADRLTGEVEGAVEYIKSLSGILDALESITQKDTLEKQQVDTNTLVRNCILLTQDKWQPYADMDINLQAGGTPVKCYPDEIGQMVLNLILNAAYAVRKKSEANNRKEHISISTRFAKDFMELRVADTGIGIKKQDYKRIFDSGFTTKEIGRSTGHGLALVYDIVVNRYKGTIEFKSTEGMGTEFTVRIPF